MEPAFNHRILSIATLIIIHCVRSILLCALLKTEKKAIDLIW